MSTETSPKFMKIARIREKARGTYLESIRFPVSETETNEIRLAPSVVNDVSAFEKKLRDAGAVLPKEAGEVRDLLTGLAKSDAPEEWILESQTGWTPDGMGFVLPNGFVGQSVAKILGVGFADKDGRQNDQRTMAGTRKAWRSSVPGIAASSTAMMLAISAAFAAPLLTIMNRASFGINLVGPSATGKTTATLMGASVIGIGRVADLLSWNATEAGLEERLAAFNGMLFPIDELRSLKEKTPKEQYRRVRMLAYHLAQGAPTRRHSSFELTQASRPQRWSAIMLTSNERPISELAHAADETREPGEARRLIDVQVLFDGQDHIFDRLPGDFDYSAFQSWKAGQFKKAADACLENHGKTFRKFVNSLLAEKPKLHRYVEARVAFFAKKVVNKLDGDIARDVADKFGLIYAGGMLGIRHNLLPWDKKELCAAIAKAYVAARDLLPDDGVALRKGITLLRAKLSELPLVSKKSAKKTDFDQIDGYRKRRNKGPDLYLIKREQFNLLFTSNKQRELVIDWLIQNQLITLATPKNTMSGLPPQPQHQFVWPDRRRNSYKVKELPKP